MRCYRGAIVPRVKGLAFRSVLVALEELEGAQVVQQAKQALPPTTRERLDSLTASSWYPTEDYVALWSAIQAVTGARKDFPRIIGRRATEMDFTLVHRVAFAALSPETVLGISMRLFNTYYDTGTCVTAKSGERRVTVTFTGCKGFNANLWTELRGAIECFAEKSSGRRAMSTVLSGGTGPDCAVEVSWSAKER